MTTRYMHLIDGSPAAFSQKDQYIYFMSNSGQNDPLATPLRQIRREQRIYQKARQDSNLPEAKLSYVRVNVGP